MINNVKEVREEQKMTQCVLAGTVGISRQNITIY